MSTTNAASPTDAIAATSDVPTAATRAPRDVRSFWRVLLAVIAPLPMLFMGVYYVLSPTDGDAPLADTVAAYAADMDRAELLQWLQTPFIVLLIPATFAVAWAARRGAPRLTTAGALIALTGQLAGFGLLGGGGPLAYLTVTENFDVATMARLDEAIWELPIVLVGGLLFIVGITIGFLLLGLALWRSRVAPAWMGILLGVGGFTHPFMPGHVASGLGLVVTAVGFTGASYALLRMRNDDFDLPAVAPSATELSRERGPSRSGSGGG